MAKKKHPKESVEVVKTEVVAAPVEAPIKKAKIPFKQSLLGFIKTKKGKFVLAGVSVVLVLAVVAAVPLTRYSIAGLVLKKDVSIALKDSKTGKPVSGATVSVGAYSAQTDGEGRVVIGGVPVGQYDLAVTKQLYNQVNKKVTVPILSGADLGSIDVEANGVQVPVVVVNKITTKPVANAKLTVSESTTLTNENGEAALIAPIDLATIKVFVEAEGYNGYEVELATAEQPGGKIEVPITPAGKIYFLSKRTGKINVMKSNLDGSDPQVVVEGTGKEDNNDTSLVASRDWKYLALKARRDGDKAKLYVIKTENNSMQTIDEGNAVFLLVGWSDHTLVFRVSRNDVASGKAGNQVIKSYDAQDSRLKEIDGLGDYQNYWFSPLLIDSEVFLSKKSHFPPEKSGIYSVSVDGANKKAIIEGDYTNSFNIRQYKTRELYIANTENDKTRYEYEGGKLTKINIDDSQFYKDYPVYLYSPSSKQTFWADARDGKSVLLLGDEEGENENKVADLSDEYRQYGWYTDDYLLVSKSSSELHILPATGGAPVKITDYHRSADYLEYGGGYGGY